MQRLILVSVVLLAWLLGAEAAENPPNWPTNPYWTGTQPPNGPGHKVKDWKEMLEKAGGAANVGIKVGGLEDYKTNRIGSFSVGDEIKFRACIGDKNSPLAFNHKSGDGDGLKYGTVVWMQDGKPVAEEKVDGGCG